MAHYLLDTNVIIDALNGKRGRAPLLAGLVREGHLLGCCAINVAEVYAGLRASERVRTFEFLQSLSYYEMTRSIASNAGLMKRDWARKGTTLALTDALIAAVAIEHNLTLITANARHFPMPEVKLYPLGEKDTS